MIYELRTYSIKPTTLPEVLKRFEEGYEHRKKYGEMLAFWYTEIGPLNQIIHLWPYQDLAERTRIRAEASKDPNWPPKIQEYLVKMDSEIYVPFPFSPEPTPGEYGRFYEMRSYFVKADGGMAGTMSRWEPKIPGRMALSPLLLVAHTEIGPLNKYMHIWPYQSLDQRMDIRKEAMEKDIWPPGGGAETLVSQENKIMIPAPFSPMR